MNEDLTKALAGIQEAVQATLDEYFPDEHLEAQVTSSDTNLAVGFISSDLSPKGDYEQIAEAVMMKLRKLALPDVALVKFYCKSKKRQELTWRSSRPLVVQIPQPFKKTKSNGLVGKTTTNKASAPQTAKSKFQGYLEQFSHYSNVISAASLLGLLLLLGFNTLAGQKTQTVTYEYKVTSIPDTAFTENMNQLGTEGWELVFARRAQDSTTDEFSYEVIFKRPKQ